MSPKVSFVIPCYKLAHYLGDCLKSIFTQTFADFEVLIMDDCSPDNTPEVAAGFKDPRVIHHRNPTNLGHIRNYNKGIEMTRGKYIWLISADDCLRSQIVLKKYVDLLDKNPQVGYVFCPAMILRDGKEAGVEGILRWHRKRDDIISGREIVRYAAYSCPILSPTALVRRECYTRISMFQENQPRTSDWYLWAMFAMKYDVGYFAEPMVYYREHTTNMELTMKAEQPALFYEQDLLTIWTLKDEAQKAGIEGLSEDFQRSIADAYTKKLISTKVEGWQYGRTWDDALREIKDHAANSEEVEEILRLIRIAWPARLAIGYYKAGQTDEAIENFRFALAQHPRAIKTRVYLSLVRFERLFGIRLVPLIRSLIKSAASTLRWPIRQSLALWRLYFDKN
ncbi:MAG: glycosyltransferase family 2 protein [Blastocatellia bacterium]|nr:glycosyltransferase family 2 protein [Blastocatellia bacterium]